MAGVGSPCCFVSSEKVDLKSEGQAIEASRALQNEKCKFKMQISERKKYILPLQFEICNLQFFLFPGASTSAQSKELPVLKIHHGLTGTTIPGRDLRPPGEIAASAAREFPQIYPRPGGGARPLAIWGPEGGGPARFAQGRGSPLRIAAVGSPTSGNHPGLGPPDGRPCTTHRLAMPRRRNVARNPEGTNRGKIRGKPAGRRRVFLRTKLEWILK